MPTFRKKPLDIEAYQFTEDMVKAHLFDGEPMPAGVKLGHSSYHPEQRRLDRYSAFVTTIQGQRVKIEPGEWIVLEPDGIHYYPIAPDVFAKTYDPT